MSDPTFWQTVAAMGQWAVALTALVGTAVLGLLRRGDTARTAALTRAIQEQQHALNEHMVKQLEAANAVASMVAWDTYVGDRDIVLRNVGGLAALNVEVTITAHGGEAMEIGHPPLPWPRVDSFGELHLRMHAFSPGFTGTRFPRPPQPYKVEVHYVREGGELATDVIELWE